MFEQLKKITMALTCHRSLYSGLTASYVWAAIASEHPEIYAPMVLLHGLLAIRG